MTTDEPGDVADGGLADSPAVSPDDEVVAACMAWLEAECSLYQRCEPFLYDYFYPTERDCMSGATRLCERFRGAPGVAPDSPAFLACAGALATFDCAALSGNDRFPEPCYFHGLLEDGVSCASSAQCSSGCCHFEEEQMCGTCRELASGPFACESVNDCPLGMGCHGGQCAPSVGLGQPCVSAPCKANLVCRDFECAVPLSEGEPCSTWSDECDGYHGQFCHPYAERCVQFVIAGQGQPCGWVGAQDASGYYAACAGGAPCEGAEGTAVCKPMPGEGDACDPSADRPCSDVARCVGGVCRVSDPSMCVGE